MHWPSWTNNVAFGDFGRQSPFEKDWIQPLTMAHLDTTQIPVTPEEDEAFEAIEKQIAARKTTKAQADFIAADKHYETVIKPFLEDYKAAKKAVIDEMGLGKFFQDEDGTVYKSDECEGKFVHFEPFQIKRTRRGGETKGTLSMTEAREAGFVVEGK